MEGVEYFVEGMCMDVGEVKLATTAFDMGVVLKARESGVSFPFDSGLA
jgi:hypothetical protein